MEYKYICLDIIPLSPFATEPVSDTFFGQICYMLYMQGYDIDDILKDYDSDPFLVVSDFFPMGYISAQQMPAKPSEEINVYELAARKTLKKKNKLKLESLISGGSLTIEKNGLIKETVDLSESGENWRVIQYDVVRAHLNRITGTTLDEEFAPYSNVEYNYTAKNGHFYFKIYLYIKKITRYNMIHMFFSLIFSISALLFLTGLLSGDFVIDKALNGMILVVSGVVMGVIKMKVAHLKRQRYSHLTDNESISDFGRRNRF